MKRRCAVIGAGAAGIAASKTLLDAGMDVTVFEANDYVGGRIKQFVHEKTGPLELGASLINNKRCILAEIARERQILDTQNKKAQFIIRHTPVGVAGLLKHLKFSDLLRYGKVFQQLYDYDGADKSATVLFDSAGISPALRRVLYTAYSSSAGTPLEQVGIRSLAYSLKQAGLRVEKDLVSYYVKGSFLELLSEMLSVSQSHIRLSSPVVALEYGNQDVSVVLNDKNTVRFDCVIVTVSLAVLKNDIILFDPPLPAEKQNAVRRLGMGRGVKIVLHFKQPLVKSGTAHLLDCDNSLFYFVHAAADGGQVLIAYVLNPAFIALTDEEMTHSIVEELDRVFKGEASSSLDFVKVQNWTNEKFIGGTYSFDAIDSIGCRETLAQPLGNKVYFAGEACINGYAATVDGALLSGQAAAGNVIQDWARSSASLPV